MQFILRYLCLLSSVLFSPLLSANQLPPASQATPRAQVKERIVWGVPISPYVRVVLVTLNEKNLPYEHKKIFPTVLAKVMNQEIDPDFAKASPLGKIPAYEEIAQDNSRFSLAESAVIADYINDSVSLPALRPQGPKANAQVSFFIAYANNVLAPATHALVFENVVKPGILKQNADKERIEKILSAELPAILDYLDKSLADGRPWIAGTQNLSLADIAIVSHLASLDFANLPSISAVSVIGNQRPHLKAYYQKIIQRDSFKKALSDK